MNNTTIQDIHDNLPETYQQMLYNLAKKMEAQAEKGRERYGTTIDESQGDISYWREQIMEEIADGLVYLQKLLDTCNKKT